VAPLCCWVNNIQENQKVSFGAFLALDAAAKNSNYSKRRRLRVNENYTKYSRK
jgi:hypothetical protein